MQIIVLEIKTISIVPWYNTAIKGDRFFVSRRDIGGLGENVKGFLVPRTGLVYRNMKSGIKG